MNSISIEDTLKKYGEITRINKGYSMMPMLRPNKDLFTIAKHYNKRYKKNDVILFRRNKQLILHRIIDVQKETYTTKGDNCDFYEYGIKDNDILGSLVSFQRDGKTYSINDIRYKMYVFFIRMIEKPRIVIKRLIKKD